MSDITALREILADGDTPSASTPAPEPLDGVPQESVSAEPETEEGDELSAEERVAALAREGMDEADAEPDPEDVAADAGDPEPDEQEEDDLQALVEEGKRARAEKAGVRELFRELTAKRSILTGRCPLCTGFDRDSSPGKYRQICPQGLGRS